MRRKKLVNLENAQRGSYGAVIQQILKDRVCPFCPEHLLKYHTEPILRRGTYWLATKNFRPYVGATVHLLFIHHKHLENLSPIEILAWRELLEMCRWAIKKFKLKGATLMLRTGDPNYTGGSVQHLHAQLVSGNSRARAKAFPIKPVVGFGTPVQKKRKPR